MQASRYLQALTMGVFTCGLMSPVGAAFASGSNLDARLDLSQAVYRVESFTVNGKELAVRIYENLPYVTNPTEPDFQVLNLFVPEVYYVNASITSSQGSSRVTYTKDTAPILIYNKVGGYMPARPAELTPQPGVPAGLAGKDREYILAALEHGYVVASPGARGRTLYSNGVYTGKAPAVIVDLKAAVRYLRANDAHLPGSAERLVSIGTSAGGAVSYLLGASANSPLYASYMQQMGVANASDEIFAVQAYCPISLLPIANEAYEWQYRYETNYKTIKITQLDYNVERKEVAGTLTAEQTRLAQDLAQRFPAIVNDLKLTHKGQPLTLNADGTGSFLNYVYTKVIESAQAQLDAGRDMSGYDFLTIADGHVTKIDVYKYVHYMTRLKTPGAFDSLDNSTGENNLFGDAKVDNKHFTTFMYQRAGAPQGLLADLQTVQLMDPWAFMHSDVDARKVPQYWRIRHGTKDRDTSLAISAILAIGVEQAGREVDYFLPWDVPHSGDYDRAEFFAWVDKIVAQANRK